MVVLDIWWFPLTKLTPFKDDLQFTSAHLPSSANPFSSHMDAERYQDLCPMVRRLSAHYDSSASKNNKAFHRKMLRDLSWPRAVPFIFMSHSQFAILSWFLAISSLFVPLLSTTQWPLSLRCFHHNLSSVILSLWHGPLSISCGG